MNNNPLKSGAIVWEADVPLVTSRFVLGSTVKWIVLTYVVCIAWIGYIFLAIGEGRQIPMLAGIFAIICAGLFVLSLLIMLVFFGNRMPMRFAVDNKGVGSTVISRRARTASRIAAIAGALTGRPGLAGAGILAASSENTFVPWTRVTDAVFDRTSNTIVLRGARGTLAWLVCTPETFETVRSRIEAQLSVPIMW